MITVKLTVLERSDYQDMPRPGELSKVQIAEQDSGILLYGDRILKNRYGLKTLQRIFEALQPHCASVPGDAPAPMPTEAPVVAEPPSVQALAQALAGLTFSGCTVHIHLAAGAAP